MLSKSKSTLGSAEFSNPVLKNISSPSFLDNLHSVVIELAHGGITPLSTCMAVSISGRARAGSSRHDIVIFWSQ